PRRHLSELDIQLWWQDHYRDMFISLSLVVFFALLVIGSYMLIANLSHEERRGTLNFIRLSPQSTGQFWLGKLLGVPILLYLAIAMTIPFHLWSGLSGKIPLAEIISFWVILIASCGFFFSAALLFGLFGSWFSGFQAWLGSGAVLAFLLMANFKPINNSSFDWLSLFSPSVLFPYLVNETNSRYTSFPFHLGKIQAWQFFNLPLGMMGFSIVVLTLLNYGLWTYWIGQAFNRQFRNPGTTLLSKRHSYLFTACWITFTLGFALQEQTSGYSYQFPDNVYIVLAFNLVLFLGLIAALSPQRQALQDWARYRHQNRSTVKSSLMADLLWGEKSPALLAIAMNCMIVALPLTGWILLASVDINLKLQAFASLILSLSMILIYSAIAQFILLMKTPKRGIWATGIVVATIVLPPTLLSVLSIYPGQNWGGLWLFTAFPWDYVMRHASIGLVLQAFLVQVIILGGLNWQLRRQLRLAGESATKALLAGRLPLSN
ncbi:ABC transporter permease, partial [Coleofasciculus sp.]|uniref:ABC transporter permease n=1 Tax=Coleofasciculus sp. TaxID=3100458 RepID=UPI003A20E3C0